MQSSAIDCMKFWRFIQVIVCINGQILLYFCVVVHDMDVSRFCFCFLIYFFIEG